MLPTKFSFLRYFLIILVCWLGVNDAIPYGVHSNKKPARPYAFEELQGSDPSTNSDSVGPSTDETSESVSNWPDESSEDSSINNNTNVNVNVNSFHPIRNKTGIIGKPSGIQAHSKIPGKTKQTNNTNSAIDLNDKIAYCLDQHNLQSRKDETVLQKCPIRAPRSDQPHGQSFPRKGPSINVEGDFKVTGEREAKKTSSVYTGEDITLCWIELTTIREDSTSNPPRKLVIREFAISFENADTISEKDMDCSRIRGEILPGEEKTVCESSLDGIIVDDTKRSRVVESSKNSHNDSINVRQYKKIKCAKGSVVSKDIYEWPDNTDNPRKRVEIKVGPSVQNVRSGKDGGSSICTPKAVVPDSEEGLTAKPADECSSGEACETTVSCEDTNSCDKTDGSCEDGMCTSTSVPNEILTTTELPDHSTEPLYPSDTSGDDTCSDSGDCNSEPTIIKPDTNSAEDCSQGDCTAGTSDDSENVEDCSQDDCTTESSNETSDSGTEESGSSCTDDDCTSEEELTTAKTEISTEANKSCQEGSESCDCSSSSCSGEVTENPNSLESENQVTGESITPSEKRIPKIPHNNTICDSQSLECLSSSTSPTDNEKITVAATVSKDTGNGERSTVDNEVMTTLPDEVVSTTSPSEEITTLDTPFSTIDVASSRIPLKSAVPFCLDPTSKDCVTEVPTPSEGTTQLTSGTQKYSPFTKRITQFGVTEENPTTYETETVEYEEDSSCQQDPTGKNCQSNESSDETSLPVSTSRTFIRSSEESENSTNPDDFTFTPMPMTSTVSGIPITEDTTELKHPDVTEEETSTQESSVETKSESCESSENCNSTEDHSSYIGSKDGASGSSVNSIASCENSSCSDSSEDCVNVTLTDSSKDCEDGSSSGDCSGNDSSEQIDSTELIKKTVILTTEPSVPDVKPNVIPINIDNVSTTAETRRTTVSSKAQPEDEKKHKLALKIKVLLEHINEKEEKEKLVQLEKHLLLDEMLDQHGNHSLIWHLKSLNNSNNIKTFKSIFNLTELANLTEVFSHVTEFDGRGRKKASKLKTGGRNGRTLNETLSRSKRDISGSNNAGKKANNDTDTAKVKAIRESLPGVQEDFRKGIGHVLGKISHEFNGSALSAINKTAETSTSTIMKILSGSGDKMLHSRREKRATKMKNVSVEELKHPVNGEEIGRWSNERFVASGDGGRVRSLLEFEIMRDSSNDIRKIGLGS